ncbi:MAG: hypothetical protein JWM77_36 [Rhodospirillales bacterium]|jgi:3-methyladenine DNA glycosylase AlkD|nr:hypothetical protein [Rhodospirillales bacterium]
MAAKKSVTKTAPKPARTPAAKAPAPLDLRAALAALQKHATGQDRANLERFGIVTADKVLGVSMKNIQAVAAQIGRNHALAEALWATGCHEARLLTAYIANPARVTAAQMDRWAKDFDNWAVCDTLCFKLWDQSPHAWSKVETWTSRRDEYVKRAGFALLASLALHDKSSGNDAAYRDGLKRIEEQATDERNFVKKGVLWALRGIATRNAAMKREATATAKRLAASNEATSRWIGKTALREMAKRV